MKEVQESTLSRSAVVNGDQHGALLSGLAALHRWRIPKSCRCHLSAVYRSSRLCMQTGTDASLRRLLLHKQDAISRLAGFGEDKRTWSTTAEEITAPTGTQALRNGVFNLSWSTGGHPAVR